MTMSCLLSFWCVNVFFRKLDALGLSYTLSYLSTLPVRLPCCDVDCAGHRSPHAQCPAPTVRQGKEQLKAQVLMCHQDLALSDPWFPPVPQLEIPFLSLSSRPILATLCGTHRKPWVIGSTALSCQDLFSNRLGLSLTPLLPAQWFIDLPVLTVCHPNVLFEYYLI